MVKFPCENRSGYLQLDTDHHKVREFKLSKGIETPVYGKLGTCLNIC